jgi:hypothetical protein
MHLNDEPLSLYDVLELTPDATPQEIRSAYLRLKSSYGKENIAHYTLFSREETEAMLQKIENAYVTLSNPEKRRGYDHENGQGAMHDSMADIGSYGIGQTTASFDMMAETMGNSQPNFPSQSNFPPQATPLRSPVTHPAPVAAITINDVDSLIQNEQEWSGAAIKRIREARRMTLDDLSDYTRISKSYIHALEEEDYNKLPAVVYIRGFLQQVGKRLKLPTDQLMQKYLIRLKSARPDKA